MAINSVLNSAATKQGLTMPCSKINKLYGKSVKKNKQTPEEISGFLKKARERARDGATFWKENWEAAEDDLKFLAGEQWPSQVRTERELEQRPCLVNNVLTNIC